MSSMHASVAPANPYVGPRPFRRGELFYGRERDVADLVNTLVSARTVLFHSPSGAGKTSLIQAGVIPAFEKRRFQICARRRADSAPLRVNEPVPKGLRVDNRYAFSVITAMLGSLRSPIKLLSCTISEALDLLAKQPDAKERQLIVIDQFEELLTLDPTDQDGQRAFFQQLGEALDKPNRWALLAMREDYMGGLDSYVGHIPGQLRSTYRLDFLESGGALTAIQTPADVRGVTFRDDAASLLVEDLSRISVEAPETGVVLQKGRYVEPVLLQVVCKELWQKLSDQYGPNFRIVAADDVQGFGPLDAALAQYYRHGVHTAVGDNLAAEREVRDWIDRKLITQQQFRGQSRIKPDVSDKDQVLRSLQDRYLIRAELHTSGTWWELSHDRLIAPIISDNEVWRHENLQPWQEAADHWHRSGRKKEFLLTGDAYLSAQLQSRKASNIKEVERDFLEESGQLSRQLEESRRASAAERLIQKLRVRTLFLLYFAFFSFQLNIILLVYIILRLHIL